MEQFDVQSTVHLQLLSFHERAAHQRELLGKRSFQMEHMRICPHNTTTNLHTSPKRKIKTPSMDQVILQKRINIAFHFTLLFFLCRLLL